MAVLHYGESFHLFMIQSGRQAEMSNRREIHGQCTRDPLALRSVLASLFDLYENIDQTWR